MRRSGVAMNSVMYVLITLSPSLSLSLSLSVPLSLSFGTHTGNLNELSAQEQNKFANRDRQTRCQFSRSGWFFSPPTSCCPETTGKCRSGFFYGKNPSKPYCLTCIRLTVNPGGTKRLVSHPRTPTPTRSGTLTRTRSHVSLDQQAGLCAITIGAVSAYAFPRCLPSANTASVTNFAGRLLGDINARTRGGARGRTESRQVALGAGIVEAWLPARPDQLRLQQLIVSDCVRVYWPGGRGRGRDSTHTHTHTHAHAHLSTNTHTHTHTHTQTCRPRRDRARGPGIPVHFYVYTARGPVQRERGREKEEKQEPARGGEATVSLSMNKWQMALTCVSIRKQAISHLNATAWQLNLDGSASFQDLYNFP